MKPVFLPLILAAMTLPTISAPTIAAASFVQATEASQQEITASAKRFLDLFFDDEVTLAELEAAVSKDSLENGPDRLMGLLRALNNHFRRPGNFALSKEADGQYSVILDTEQNTKAKMVLEISAETGFKVGTFAVRPYQAPLSNESAGLPDLRLVDIADAYVEKLGAEDKFSGTVIVAKNGRPFYMTFIGDADKSTGRKNTLDTPINLGSINKMFTGVAIAQLVESGRIHWQDTVGKHLPNYPDKEVREKVTIAQLLSHTSGMEAFVDDDDFDRYHQTTDVAGLIDVISDNPLAFEPGSRFQYSNAGPWVLGRIIESVSGEDYYSYVQKNIFDKAGMRNSGYYKKTDPNAGFAIGYLKPRQQGNRGGSAPNSAPWGPNTDIIGIQGSPAGGGYASARDMLAFANALRSGTLLKPATFKTMTTGRSGPGADKSYGYLFGVRETNGFTHWGHNGGAPGIQADFNHFPDLGYTIIVLSNYGGAAIPLSRKLIHWFTQGETAHASG